MVGWVAYLTATGRLLQEGLQCATHRTKLSLGKILVQPRGQKVQASCSYSVTQHFNFLTQRSKDQSNFCYRLTLRLYQFKHIGLFVRSEVECYGISVQVPSYGHRVVKSGFYFTQFFSMLVNKRLHFVQLKLAHLNWSELEHRVFLRKCVHLLVDPSSNRSRSPVQLSAIYGLETSNNSVRYVWLFFWSSTVSPPETSESCTMLSLFDSKVQQKVLAANYSIQMSALLLCLLSAVVFTLGLVMLVYGTGCQTSFINSQLECYRSNTFSHLCTEIETSGKIAMVHRVGTPLIF